MISAYDAPMIRIILIRFWPAFIPLALYVLWMVYRRYKAKRHEDPIPKWMDGPWLWSVTATALLLIGALFWWGLSSEPNAGTNYQPKQLIDGKLTPQHFGQ